MFFDISTRPNNRLPVHTKIGKWTLSTDLGWHVSLNKGEVVASKGLFDNRCSINFQGDTWKLQTPTVRTFPLWSSTEGDRVTNCEAIDQKIHNFNRVSHDGTLNIEFNEPTWVRDMFLHKEYIDREDLRDKICETIVAQAELLPCHGLPIMVPNTGGVDTTLVRSILDYAGVMYETTVSKDNQSQTQQYVADNFWGYQQMADTTTAHIQVTGFWGDEYLQRNPLYTHLYLQQFDKDITMAYDDRGQSYMRNFFDHHYREKISQFDCTDTPRLLLKDMMLNDFQMWHIDECLTWTPLGDVEILKLSLQATPDVAIDQCVNAGLSLSIIEQLNPHNLEIIDVNKNKRPTI